MERMHETKTAQVICDICAKEFSNKHSLSIHRVLHFEQEKVQCKVCIKW